MIRVDVGRASTCLCRTVADVDYHLEWVGGLDYLEPDSRARAVDGLLDARLELAAAP